MLSLSERSSSTFPNCRKRRRRGRTRRTPCYSSPSSSLLSLLATVVSTSSVNASPVVLPFLCPGLENESSYTKREGLDDQTTDAKSARAKGRKRRLPDRYVRGSDGLWRKTDWSLYGSSMCVDCPESTSSTTMPTADAADDTVNTGAATSTTTTSTTAASSTTSTDDFMDSLPPGWKPLQDSDHTVEILSISLSLAFFICLVMIFCVIWRRGKKRSRDVEKKRTRSRNASSADDLEVMIKKEMKTKKKVIARATALWKANARYTFRQRRGKRKTVFHANNEPTTNTIEAQTSPSSPAHSRRSSIDSTLTRNLDSHVDQTTLSTCASGEHPSPSSLSPISSPPAYLHHPLSTNNHNLSSPGRFNSTTSDTHSRRASVSSLAPDALSICQPFPYTASHHMAHVATDDKALLERLNQLVSAPDGSTFSNNHETPNVAPVWLDEELSDFTELEAPCQESSSFTGSADDDSYDRSYPFHNRGSMIFPPPPVLSLSSNEKGKGVAVYPYEYPYHPDQSYGPSFDYEQDTLDVEPQAGPSAPPFEFTVGTFDASPSAPPLELPELSISEYPSAARLLISNDAEGDSAAVESVRLETYGSNHTTQFAGLSEDSVRASRACVIDVSPEEPSPDGLLASNTDKDPDGRTFESSLST
ncbi:hypothetical protein F5890DRAFT_468883 [Lentinula detonsa]|uniref:Uncharacterized protein n=1 Tax=Lentinula detonsa TaxID=2804962 RepID=A0AA38Q6W3_9AGAR|nr:hypothetical protein F5890DRAFT_468883 [Lentinula detonsa]